MTRFHEDQAPCLDLRASDARWEAHPEAVAATLADFQRPCARDPKVRARTRATALGELMIADHIARQQLAQMQLSEAVAVHTSALSRARIPLAPWTPDAAVSTEDWRIESEVAGECVVIGEGLARSGSTAGRWIRVLAAAAALPVVLAPTAAIAGAPTLTGAVVTGELEADAPALPDEPSATPAPAEGEVPAESAAAPAPAPTVAPPPTPSPEALSLTGEVLWEGLMNTEISLAMNNSQSVTGALVAQSPTELAIARSADGTLVSVPKADVAGVRLRMDGYTPSTYRKGVGALGDRPTEDGRGLLGAGVVLVGAGSVLTLTGISMLAIYPSGLHINLPTLLPGLAMLGAGGAMISVSKKRHAAFKKAWGLPETARLQMTPTFGVGKRGGQAGLVLRF
ncbi:hypothetical protein PPSIR1_32053 [Plesiocystis pacifica SIR-1]|uniref:Uncharacterized protein n=1 Tax=Plesiocystis pacifica SIR-1 TaxID=391625 RepID=A6G2X8_9BACT|nr:hypothetical protein [Plesiocystis pacifica]EDM79828.1 hypothetical protein PPSIR1_32053 [Plesiocystis pacifica SIR-1]